MQEAQFYWTKKTLTDTYAKFFTKSEWEQIEESEAFEILAFANDYFTAPGFFEAFSDIKKQDTNDKESLLRKFSFNQVLGFLIESTKLSIYRKPVVEWLGLKLTEKIQNEKDPEIYNLILDALDKKDIRDRLECYKGEDIRKQLLNGKIEITQLYDIAIALKENNKEEIQVPTWAEDNSTLKEIIQSFSPEQLQILEKSFKPVIKDSHEGKISLLTAILLTTIIDGKQCIAKYTNDIFQKLVNDKQEDMLYVKGTPSRYKVKSRDNLPFMYQVNKEEFMIRTYLTDYKKAPLPADLSQRKVLLETAFRNAASQGKTGDVVATIVVIQDINVVGGKTGRSALHWAAIYASKTGDTDCFNFLMEQPNADLFKRDNDKKTPLDLWDFTKNPNPFLLELHQKQMIEEKSAIKNTLQKNNDLLNCN